jgi:hypothetical protein
MPLRRAQRSSGAAAAAAAVLRQSRPSSRPLTRIAAHRAAHYELPGACGYAGGVTRRVTRPRGSRDADEGTRRRPALSPLDDWKRGCTAPPASSSDPSDRVFAAVAQTRRLCSSTSSCSTIR